MTRFTQPQFHRLRFLFLAALLVTTACQASGAHSSEDGIQSAKSLCDAALRGENVELSSTQIEECNRMVSKSDQPDFSCENVGCGPKRHCVLDCDGTYYCSDSEVGCVQPAHSAATRP